MTDNQHVRDHEQMKKYSHLFGVDSEAAQEMGREELNERVERVYEAAGLTYREKAILDLRYGTGDGLAYTQKEVGKIFRVTKERARQIEAKALRKLKGSLEGSLEN